MSQPKTSLKTASPKTSTDAAKKIIYLTLYKEGQDAFAKHSPCNIRTENGRTICDGTYKDDVGLCCEGCAHLGPDGCTVGALACKLWLCHNKHREHPELVKELAGIAQKAHRQKIPLGFRASMEENFAHTHAITLRRGLFR